LVSFIHYSWLDFGYRPVFSHRGLHSSICAKIQLAVQTWLFD